MSQIDDIVTQFQAALSALGTKLQTAISGEDAAVAARLQPIADEFTALANDPSTQVPAAAGATTSTGDTTSISGTTTNGTTGGTSTPAPTS